MTHFAKTAILANTVSAVFHESQFIEYPYRAEWPVGRRGHQFLGKDGLDFAVNALRVPGRIGEKALQRQDLILAHPVILGFAEEQSHGFGTFAARRQEKTAKVNERL